MWNASFKITKVSLGNVQKLYETQKKQEIQLNENRVFEDIVNAMLGKNYPHHEVREKKIKDVKMGRYNQLMMKVYPSQIYISKNADPEACISASVDEIQHTLFQFYMEKLRMEERKIDFQKEAIKRVQQNGIVFIDQIDKLITRQDNFTLNANISREGVQRDLLPIIEGTLVKTKIGDVRTDNILFIACGAFSMSKVDDLIPELLGRLPIRVEMAPISQQQLTRILTQPKYNLLMQQIKLLQQEGVKLTYTADSIQQIARFAYDMNTNTQNIGARRLQMITQKIIEDVSYDSQNYQGTQFVIDANYVRGKLSYINSKFQTSRYLI